MVSCHSELVELRTMQRSMQTPFLPFLPFLPFPLFSLVSPFPPFLTLHALRFTVLWTLQAPFLPFPLFSLVSPFPPYCIMSSIPNSSACLRSDLFFLISPAFMALP